MRLFDLILVAGLCGVATTGAVAQQTQAPSSSLPEVCRSAMQGQANMMPNMPMGNMPMQNMQMGNMPMQNMPEANKAYLNAMMKMHREMMPGMMARDADVAFVCSMIAYHQGALDIAGVALKFGNNAEVKKIAEKTIREQTNDTAELQEWLKNNAK